PVMTATRSFRDDMREYSDDCQGSITHALLLVERMPTSSDRPSGDGRGFCTVKLWKARTRCVVPSSITCMTSAPRIVVVAANRLRPSAAHAKSETFLKCCSRTTRVSPVAG